MPVLEVVPANRRNPRTVFYNKFASNVYSTQGEDGLIDVVFRVLPPKNKWCVEFGAWDGFHLSNTANLDTAGLKLTVPNGPAFVVTTGPARPASRPATMPATMPTSAPGQQP